MQHRVNDFKYNLKRYFEFSSSEIINVLLLSFVIAAIFTLENKTSEFILYFGVSLFLIAIKIILQKIFAIQFGYKAFFDFDSWKKYLVLLSSIFIVFPFKIFYPGTIRIENIPELRIGKRAKFPEQKDLGIISYCGLIPLLIILFAIIKMPFFSESLPISVLTNLSYMLIILSILPFPYFDGFNLVYGSRTLYVLYTSLIALILILINIGTSITTSILTAILLALTITTLYFYSYEIKYL